MCLVFELSSASAFLGGFVAELLVTFHTFLFCMIDFLVTIC